MDKKRREPSSGTGQLTPPQSRKKSKCVPTPERGTPYYGRQANLLSVLGISRLRDNTNDPSTSYAMLASPFLTNDIIVDEMIENARYGVQQYVYVSPAARNAQHGKHRVDKLQQHGIPVYIFDHLHTKAVQMRYVDTYGYTHKKDILGSANVTYRGVFHNAGDSWMVLPEDQDDNFDHDMDIIRQNSVAYEQYTGASSGQPQYRRKFEHNTPKKRVINSWDHDIVGQIVKSIRNTEAGNTIEFGTFALSHPEVVQALQDVYKKGVKIRGYVNSAASIPSQAIDMPISRVDAGCSGIYHDKTMLIHRAKGATTAYYMTGNLTKQSLSSDFNQGIIIKSPRASHKIATSFRKHISHLRNDRRITMKRARKRARRNLFSEE